MTTKIERLIGSVQRPNRAKARLLTDKDIEKMIAEANAESAPDEVEEGS